MSLGDSKTVAGIWQPILARNLRAASGFPWEYRYPSSGGATVHDVRVRIAEMLAGVVVTDTVSDVLINLGTNDLPALPPEATWEADFLYIIDAVRVKWPTATVRLMRPWARGHDSATATIHSWVDTVQAARAAFVVVGPDEAVWLKGGDNGATMTTDGAHYSVAGNAECAAQWQTAMGY